MDTYGLYLQGTFLFLTLSFTLYTYVIYRSCPRDRISTILIFLYLASFIINFSAKLYDVTNYAVKKEDGTLINSINYLEILVDPITMMLIYCSIYIFIFELERMRVMLAV